MFFPYPTCDTSDFGFVCVQQIHVHIHILYIYMFLAPTLIKYDIMITL